LLRDLVGQQVHGQAVSRPEREGGAVVFAAARTIILPIKLFFGFDVFISYSRRDGAEYAEALERELAKSVAPRIDIQEAAPGRTIPLSLAIVIALSKVFVLVGSRGAAESAHVDSELRTFLRWSRGPVVLIEVSGVSNEAAWRRHVPGIPTVVESPADGHAGSPSDRVVRRTLNNVGFWRRSRRQSFATTVFALVLTALAYQSYRTSVFLRDATQEAGRQQKVAELAETRAREASAEAERQTQLVKLARADARTATEEATRQLQIAAEASRAAATARAENRRLLDENEGLTKQQVPVKRVPDVVGLSLTAAYRWLVQRGVTPGDVIRRASASPPGLVIDQSPPGGAMTNDEVWLDDVRFARTATTITLIVSAGPSDQHPPGSLTPDNRTRGAAEQRNPSAIPHGSAASKRAPGVLEDSRFLLPRRSVGVAAFSGRIAVVAGVIAIEGTEIFVTQMTGNRAILARATLVEGDVLPFVFDGRGYTLVLREVDPMYVIFGIAAND
jgi:TIR domain/PASTA domain